MEAQTAAAVAAHAPALAAMLEPAQGAEPQLTPFGRLDPPLGLARVKVPNFAYHPFIIGQSGVLSIVSWCFADCSFGWQSYEDLLSWT